MTFPPTPLQPINVSVRSAATNGYSASITFDADLLRNADDVAAARMAGHERHRRLRVRKLATANTRRYHGLLVAALDPPLGRAVLLSKLEETLTVTGAQAAKPRLRALRERVSGRDLSAGL